VVLNSAGLNRRYPMAEITLEDYDTIMDVNLKGTFNMCQSAGRAMLELGSKGSLINISSMSALIINRRRPVGVYCASKAGVNGLTRLCRGVGSPRHPRQRHRAGVLPHTAERAVDEDPAGDRCPGSNPHGAFRRAP